MGYVQESSTRSNDDSLSKARARVVAAFLRTLGVKGEYSIRGNGVGGTSVSDRKVVAAISYYQ